MSKRTQQTIKRGNNQFQASWLVTYKEWMKQKSSTHVTCTLCMKDIAFDNMGESALKSHIRPAAPGKSKTKHEWLMAEKLQAKRSLSVLHFQQDVASSSASGPAANDQNEQSNNSTNTTQSTMEMYAVPLSVATAEIRWSMKVVDHVST